MHGSPESYSDTGILVQAEEIGVFLYGRRRTGGMGSWKLWVTKRLKLPLGRSWERPGRRKELWRSWTQRRPTESLTLSACCLSLFLKVYILLGLSYSWRTLVQNRSKSWNGINLGHNVFGRDFTTVLESGGRRTSQSTNQQKTCWSQRVRGNKNEVEAYHLFAVQLG